MTEDTAGSSRQRFGRVVERRPHGSGFAGRMGTYVVRDDETGEELTFSYADIVTEGFRTVRSGERVRFLLDPERNASGFKTKRLRTGSVPRCTV